MLKMEMGCFFSFSYKIILNKSTILKLIGLSKNGEGKQVVVSNWRKPELATMGRFLIK
jgi:hypothetical protein